MFSSAAKENEYATPKHSHSSNTKEGLHKAKREAHNITNKTEEELIHAAESAGQKVRDFVDDAADKIQTTTNNVSHQVHENPIQSILVALGAGFMLGMFFRR